MRFGVALPTCTEGMAYPLPFGDHHDVVEMATTAEALGFHSVLVNDHLTTQDYVRRIFREPPRYYEPLVMLGFCAARTSRVRLMTGVVVLPMRDPVLLAKQVSTLDQLSGGRLTLGVGVGGYREEFEAARPQLKQARRSQLVEESLRGLRLLLTERRATFTGEYVEFVDIEMYPKPIQDPLPILSSGNAEGTLRRAATQCDGWMPAGLPLDRLVRGVETLRRYAVEAGRDPEELIVAPQFSICVAGSKDRAEELFQRSQVYEHLVSLQQSTLRGISVDDYVRENLIGTPDEIRRRVEALQAVGVAELAGLIVVATTPSELLDQMGTIATEIIPAFSEA